MNLVLAWREWSRGMRREVFWLLVTVLGVAVVVDIVSVGFCIYAVGQGVFMNQLALDLMALTGRDRRDAGIEQAKQSAERKVAGWSDIAYGYLLQYLANHREDFRGEQVREFAHERGCPMPAHPRAWGGVLVRGAHRGVIEKVGVVQVENPTAHMANANLWRASQ